MEKKKTHLSRKKNWPILKERNKQRKEGRKKDFLTREKE